MRRISMLLLLAVWAATGCFGGLGDTRARKELPSAPLPASAPVLTADQITAQNAHKIVQSEWDAMDRDAQKEMVPAKKR